MRLVAVRTVAAALPLLSWSGWAAAAQSGRRAAPPPPAAILAGQVLDDMSDAPLAGVTVVIAGLWTELTTDARGRFTVVTAAPAGTVRLAVALRRVGYRPATQLVDVAAGDTTRVSFFLLRGWQQLDPVTVVAEAPSRSPKLEAFERRRRRNTGGTFLTRDYIERRNAVETVDLMRGLLGVRVVDSAGVKLFASTRGVRAVSLGGGKVDAGPCYMLVGIDGQLKYWGYNVNELSPKEIHGIEVYNGPATMPRELLGMAAQQEASCGLVMIWTRVDR